jgi:uncharacterized low-complexity protein
MIKMKMTAFAVGGLAAIILLTGVAILVSAGSSDDPLGTGSESGFMKKVQKTFGDLTREQSRDGSCGETDPVQTQEQNREQTRNGTCGETEPVQTREKAQTQTQTQAQNGTCNETEPVQSQTQTQEQAKNGSCGETDPEQSQEQNREQTMNVT